MFSHNDIRKHSSGVEEPVFSLEEPVFSLEEPVTPTSSGLAALTDPTPTGPSLDLTPTDPTLTGPSVDLNLTDLTPTGSSLDLTPTPSLDLTPTPSLDLTPTPSLDLTPTQQGLTSLLVLICIGSLIAAYVFQRTVQRYYTRFHSVCTTFNGLLLGRAAILQVNLLMELTLFVIILQPWWVPLSSACFALNVISSVCAFSITYVTMWLSLVRLLLLAVARWAPRHGWRVTSSRVYILILLLYAPSVTFFVMKYEPTIAFFICGGLPIVNQPNPNVTAVGVLFLISTAANTLLLYADATMPPAPPRRRNVLSARRFALFTLCEQMLVLLWVPATALTAGITRALLIRALMISQAGLLDTLGLAMLSPQLRAALFGLPGRRVALRRAPKVAPLPTIRLELI